MLCTKAVVIRSTTFVTRFPPGGLFGASSSSPPSRTPKSRASILAPYFRPNTRVPTMRLKVITMAPGGGVERSRWDAEQATRAVVWTPRGGGCAIVIGNKAALWKEMGYLYGCGIGKGYGCTARAGCPNGLARVVPAAFAATSRRGRRRREKAPQSGVRRKSTSLTRVWHRNLDPCHGFVNHDE